MMREVIESLERLGSVRVERYIILASAEEVFEYVNGCFVVLVVWRHTVQGKEGKDMVGEMASLVQQVSQLIQPVIH